jgi:tetratricopeptide (TPR) repeat protein
MITAPSDSSIAFGPFQLDTCTPRLLRGAVQIDLRTQALHVLRALVQNSGRCMSYEALIRDAWHGTWVSRHTVAVTVNEVQKALQDYGAWIRYLPNLGYRFEIPHSAELMRNGWHHWLRHTREGFEKAIGCFQRAVDSGGPAFQAYEGISRCYLMLGIFAMRQPREMYKEFTNNHNRAVAAGGMTPELRGDLAQGLHFFDLRFLDAEAELMKAKRENPRLAGTYIRLTVLYTCLKRFDAALENLRLAYARDSLSPILPACETMLHCCMGNPDIAAACGKKAIDLHPFLAIGRSYYAQALERLGKPDEAVAQYRMDITISPDMPRLRAEEAHCLARMGRHHEARVLLEELLERAQSEFVDSCTLAPVYLALGETNEALRLLENSFEAGSPHLSIIDVDYRFDPVRESARFARIRNHVFGELRGTSRKRRTRMTAAARPPGKLSDILTSDRDLT